MISKIAARVAERWAVASRFQLDDGSNFEELAAAAQEAEMLHADDGMPHQVVALQDEPPFFSEGEVVYVSKGAPE